MSEAAPRLSLTKRVIIVILVFIITFGAAYSVWMTYRSVQLYVQIKSAGRGWTTPVNTHDPLLGYRPLPNVSSMEMFPCGMRTPVYQDEEGIRVAAPGASSSSGARPFVLALGCSFTFGTGCAAEDTFPCLVAKGLHGTALNAGVEGYGLAQMLLRARELIPRLKPDYVLVEYAPWIVSRSIDYTSPWEAHGRTPRPYFAITPDRRYFVAPPAFATNFFRLNMSDYVEGKTGPLEFASFLFRVGAPLWSYSDAQLTLFTAKRALRMMPPLAPGSSDLVKAVYTEMADLCRGNGARMAIVVMGPGGIRPDEMPQDHIEALCSISGATCVDAYAALYARLDTPTTQAYEKTYNIWGCAPPRLVDRHPNPLAHQVIAEAVLKSLR